MNDAYHPRPARPRLPGVTLAAAPVVVDQWQLEKLALVTAKAEVLFYVPGLAADYYPTLWGRAFPDVDAALQALFAGLKPGARIAVIPEGPYVLAKTQAAA